MATNEVNVFQTSNASATNALNFKINVWYKLPDNMTFLMKPLSSAPTREIFYVFNGTNNGTMNAFIYDINVANTFNPSIYVTEFPGIQFP